MEEAIKQILIYNRSDYQYVKLAEELAELLEVVIKRYLKKPENKPSIEKLIEEMGDVLLRMKLLAEMENIKEEVNTRMHAKCTKLLTYIAEGKYKGGV